MNEPTPPVADGKPPFVLRSTKPHPCPVCDCTTAPADEAVGRRTKRTFHLHRCLVCRFVFVTDPWTDYAAIYDEAYYRGEGSDPLVDYASEFTSPETTIRLYEWRGIHRIARQLVPKGRRWLDFGCGNGGLVRHVRGRGTYDIVGYDTGAWAERAGAAGLPILQESELEAQAGKFDFVTAIEVIEHAVDPVGMLRQIRRLLKPGGVLFLTTGNTASAPADLRRWSYLSPEIHVSYFEPLCMEIALSRAGFTREERGAIGGWSDIIRFKTLKTLGVKKRSFWEQCIPWGVLAPLINRRYRVSVYPIGLAK